MRSEPQINSPKSLIYVTGAFILAPIIFLILPVVLGALAREFGFGESQLGLLATIELLGIAITATSGLFWVGKSDWQTASRLAIGVIVVGNLLTYWLLAGSSFNVLLSLRFIIGLGAGALAAVMYTYLAARADTERAAGFAFAAQTAVQVASIFVIPAIIALPVLGGIFFGAKGIFLVITIFAALLFAATGALPRGASNESATLPDELTGKGPKGPAMVVLTSFLLFFVGQSAVWGFLELYGADVGIDASATILAITLSTAAAVLGPLFASAVGDRLGQFLPISAAAVLQFLGLALLLALKVDFAILLTALIVYQVGWTMALPFHLGVLADIDPTHRFIVLVSPASAVGIALGPIFGGVFIEAFGYTALFIVDAVVFVLYLACILPFARGRSGATISASAR